MAEQLHHWIGGKRVAGTSPNTMSPVGLRFESFLSTQNEVGFGSFMSMISDTILLRKWDAKSAWIGGEKWMSKRIGNSAQNTTAIRRALRVSYNGNYITKPVLTRRGMQQSATQNGTQLACKIQHTLGVHSG